MSDLLLINIGRGNPKRYGPLGYAETQYLFDDGVSFTSRLAGLALWRWLEHHGRAPVSVCFAATPEAWKEKESLVRKEGESAGLDWSKVADPVILELPRSIENIWRGMEPLEQWLSCHSIPWENVPTLHVDLTHAYRAIPIVHTWMTLFFKRLGTVEIGFMGYGAYVPGETPTPMIDLSPVMQLADWAAAARDFEQRGDAGPLSELMGSDGAKIRSRVFAGEATTDQKKALKILGSVTNAAEAIGRYLPAGLPIELGIKTRRAMAGVRSDEVEDAVRAILPPAAPVARKIFDSASRIAWQGEIPPAKGTKKNLRLSREEIERQLRLVRLWASRGATGAALRALRELVITRVLVAQGIEKGWLKETTRKPAADALNSLRPRHSVVWEYLPEDFGRLGKFWNNVCNARNLFAHAGMSLDEVRVESEANRLAEFIEEFNDLDHLGDSFWTLQGIEEVGNHADAD